MRYNIKSLVLSLLSILIINSCSDIICSENEEIPTIVITSHQDSQLVSGIVNIQCELSQNLNILQVELFVNGHYHILSDTSQPFVLNWYTKDLTDGPYEITIRFLDSDGIEHFSEPITLFVDNSMFRPNPVNVLSVTYNKTAMKVIWNKSDATDFSHYSIYHYINGSSLYIPDIYSITDTTVTITDFNPVVENWFRVSVCDTAGYQSSGERLSNKVEQPPIIPVLNNVTKDNNSIFISWDKNNEDDFLYYILYESESSEMQHKTIAFYSNNANDTSFSENIGTDEFKFYQVEVVDYWNLSSKSEIKFTSSYPKIAFVSTRDGISNIFKMDSDGTNVINLTESDRKESYPQPFPNDSKILFLRITFGANGLKDEIFMMNEDGTNQIQLSVNTSYQRALPAISPDGLKIAYADNNGLHIIDVNNRSSDTISDVKYIATLDFSIDGELLVYSKSVTNDASIIGTVNLDGSSPETIKWVHGSYANNIYFVNDDKIIYQYSKGDSSRIYMMNSDGSNLINLTNEYPQNRLINISDDKTKLIVRSGFSNHLETRIINLDGVVINNLHISTRNTAYLSSNNKKIVYSNPGDIYLIDVDGNNLIQLTEDITNDGAPRFFHH